MEQNQDEQSNLFGMELDNEARYSFVETAKWARFLSIVTIIGLSLMIFFFLIFGSRILDGLNQIFPSDLKEMGAVLIVAMLIVSAICAVLLYYLFRAAGNIRVGINTNNQQIFNEGLNFLRIFFVIYGVLSILGTLTSLSKAF